MEDEPFYIHERFDAGATKSVATLPADIARRSLFMKDMSNEGGAVVIARLRQKRHKNAFINETVVPANSNVFDGGKPNNDRLLRFDSDATMNVEVPNPNGTLDVTLGFIDG